MTKFIKDSLKFILFLLIFYPIMIIIWGEFAPSIAKKNLNFKMGSYGSTNIRFEELKNFQNIDVLFLGSSHSYRGFDPRIFSNYGFSSFNLGTSGQSFLQTEILVKRFVNKLNPKLIIIEVFPGTFVNDGIESSLDIIANIPIDWDMVKLTFSQNHLKVYNSLIFSLYKQNLFGIENVNIPVNSNDLYISGGFNEKKVEYWKSNQKIEKSNWRLKKVQVEAFLRIVQFLKSIKIPYVLVQAPVTNALNNSITNNLIFDSLISKNGQYYNFNKLVKLNDSLHFYDNNHLNQNGVNIFNEKLIERLLNDKILK